MNFGDTQTALVLKGVKAELGACLLGVESVPGVVKVHVDDAVFASCVGEEDEFVVQEEEAVDGV